MANLNVTLSTDLSTMTMKVSEGVDKFIIESILPYCERVIQTTLEKETILEALKGNIRLKAENEWLREQLELVVGNQSDFN